MITRNSIRSKIQARCIEIWEQLHFKGYALITMGVGKTKIMADAINRIMEVHADQINEQELPIVILVNSKILRDKTVPEGLKEWGCKHPVKLFCYHSAFKWKSKSIGVLIGDELDYAISEKETYLEVFKNNRIMAYLGLTGTLPGDKKEILYSILRCRPFMSYTLKDAHRDGVINQVQFCIYDVNLGNEPYPDSPYGDTSRYKWVQKNIENLKDELTEAFRAGLPKAEISRLFNLKAYWEYSPKNKNSRINLMRTVKSLMDFAIALKVRILSSDENNKVILFSQLSKTADVIAAHTYLGKDSDKIIEAFNKGGIRELGVVKKVTRGVNFIGLNHCIVHSYNSSLTEFKQGYIGRMVRLPVGQMAFIHLLISYYEDANGERVYCQNMNWLKEILEDEELSHIKRLIFSNGI